MQSFILKSLDIEVFLEFLEKYYASKFHRITRTTSMIFGVFVHERFFKRLPGDIVLTIVVEYDIESNSATIYGVAAGGSQGFAKWEAGTHDATEHDFAIEIRKIAADHQWAVEFGPDRKALTCPYCNAQYVYLAEERKGGFGDSVRCQNCDRMFNVS
jgi:predicted Zn finger-like uncharacterized protein